MTETDPVAAALAEIQERSTAALEFPLSGFAEDSIRACTQSAMDVPRLLKVAEAALKHHVQAVIEDGAPPVYPFRYCSTCSGHPAWPCPEVAAITAALAGKENNHA